MLQKAGFLFLPFLMAAAALFGQTATLHRGPTGPRFPSASRTDGVTVFYYASLREAFDAAADDASIDRPDEITLLEDLVLDEPVTVADGRHIRLVPGNSARTIHRSANLIAYPVIWVNGDSASLTLGKPGMEHELVIDGGCLSSPPVEALCPLVSVCGPDAKLIMYDKVTLQNNKNSGAALDTSYYENGAGVFIRTQGDIRDRQAEFIMKGGTIRGNINNVQSPIPAGGGVAIIGIGIFTMEGGVIMNNTAGLVGGGFHCGGRGTFKKTGGIIYGSNAPAAFRNTALDSSTTPKLYGHAVSASGQFRNDTVGENDYLSYLGTAWGNGTYGKGEKWDNPNKAFRRILLTIILPVLALAVCLFLILRKRDLERLMKIAQAAPEFVFENVKLTSREKEIGTLLLTKLSIKQIASVMHIAYTTTDYHVRKLYRKMGVQNRTELLIQVKSEKGKVKNEE